MLERSNYQRDSGPASTIPRSACECGVSGVSGVSVSAQYRTLHNGMREGIAACAFRGRRTREPEPRTLRLVDPQLQDLLAAGGPHTSPGRPDTQIHRLVLRRALVAHLGLHRVKVDERVDAIQRPHLPLPESPRARCPSPSIPTPPTLTARRPRRRGRGSRRSSSRAHTSRSPCRRSPAAARVLLHRLRLETSAPCSADTRTRPPT